MSSAHRPTWDPAQGKDSRTNSRIVGSRDLSSHTKLKFRKPGQGHTSDVSRLDFKKELMEAERIADLKKSGKLVDEGSLQIENTKAVAVGEGDDVNSKRRKVITDFAHLDADEESDEDPGKGREKATQAEDDSEEESDEDDSDEDETAQLMKELEKIKRERAEEKARLEREKAENEQISREEEIATGNPLLNLRSAVGLSTEPATPRSTVSASSFGVNRRWDDDVIFKNQARDVSEKPKGEFVNDLLRTEFHRKFMKRFIA